MVDTIANIPLPGQRKCNFQGDLNPPPAFALDRFVAGPENALAELAVRSVLNNQGSRYNPLVLCGPQGTGKTHLACGMTVQWRRMFRTRVVCIPAREFAQELAEAFEVNSVLEFRTKYRECSLLTVDDVDRLSGRPAAQVELVHTLDALLERGSQVVLTASEPPTRLKQLHPPLASRLAAGLTVTLALPNPEVRATVLNYVAQTRQTELPAAVVKLLAERIDGTVPDLFQVFSDLEALARRRNVAIDLPMAQGYLQRRAAGREPDLADIATSAARHFGLRLADLRGPARHRAVVTARDVAMYLARKLTRRSLENIGAYFGGRDHTTVLHGCRKVEGRLESDPVIRQAAEKLEKKCLGKSVNRLATAPNREPKAMQRKATTPQRHHRIRATKG